MQANTTDRQSRLIELMERYGVELDMAKAGLMLRHVDLVIAKNQQLNLTRIVDPDDALIRHVVDSLLITPMIERKGYSPSSRLLDIGTGAGFPGIPLAIATGMRVTMIDSVGKKVAAVSEFVDTLGLDTQAHVEQARAEVYAKSHSHQFDFVTARAVAPLSVLVEYATPLLTRGGETILSKAAIAEDEWEHGQAAAEVCGLEPVSRETLELPNSQGTREIVVYRRARKSKVNLPRPDGMARKRPLG